MPKPKQKCYCVICHNIIFNRKDNALYCNDCKIKQHKSAVERQLFKQHCKKHLENINARVNKDFEWCLLS